MHVSLPTLKDSLLTDLVPFKVSTPKGERILAMTHGLTDRWGDINDFASKTRFVGDLITNDELFERLRGHMVDEESFIVATPKGYALHIEKEYYSVETDSSDDFTPSHTFEEAKKRCIDAIPELRQKWPDVTFCVGDTDWTFNGRVALWAIVRPGRYSTEHLREMIEQFPS